MEHESALPKGFRFDEYEIVRVLGAGGFGITYLAYDHNLDKPMAIKEYLPNDLAIRKGDTNVVAKSSVDQGNFDWGMERFLEEARVLAQFDHPHMPKVYRFFEKYGTGYIVMEYVEGEILSVLYKQRVTLPRTELTKIVLPLLEGLETVHSAGYLHRDIKPSNIVIRDDGRPVLIDFGSARAAIGAKSRSVTSIITPGYAPIEQYSTKGNQGPWTDIYALGAVLYRGVSGKTPDDATDRILNDELTPLAQGASSGDDAFLEAIDWALQLREAERPPDIAQWRTMLTGEKVKSAVKVVTHQKDKPKSSGISKIIVTAIVVVAIAGVALWWRPDKVADEKWQVVVKANIPEEYRQYIADGGRYSESAKTRLKALEQDYWSEAAGRNTAEAYKKYARLFPNSTFAKLAKIKAQK